MEIKKENMEWLAEAMHYVKSKVNENLPKYSTVFPTSSSENLIYGEMGNKDWTEGFWTGILCLLYEDTNEEKYLSALETLLRTFQERLDQNIDLNTHDIGFLYSLSTLAGYKITGNEKGHRNSRCALQIVLWNDTVKRLRLFRRGAIWKIQKKRKNDH